MATSRARSAPGADATTPQTQAAAAAGDGFVTYDQLRGPDLDAARWSPARLPLPTGGEHTPLDPNAALTVGDGQARVTIPRLSRSHDRFQAADSAKYLIASTRQFQLPLGAWGAAEPFIHVVESPYADFDDDVTRFRVCQVTLDRSSSTAAWRVDGRRVYQAHGTVIPERAGIGFGIWTMLPIRDGRSRSLEGQGLVARWRRFRVRGVDAGAATSASDASTTGEWTTCARCLVPSAPTRTTSRAAACSSARCGSATASWPPTTARAAAQTC